MREYRNSQKRFYNEGYTYFVTGVTKNRHPYFKEELFCEVFWENLKLCSKLKDFILHGWFLGLDHFHLLVTSMGDFNISQIMHNLKLNVSRDINRIMSHPPVIIEGEVTLPRLQLSRLQWIYRNRPNFFKQRSQFHQKHPNPILPFPKFQWQKSFHDHVIRNEKDFETHMRYIEYNLIKHEMPEKWKWWGFGDLI